MKCPKCNSEIANDSKFCENCGNPLTQKKQTVTCDISLVKWLLYGMMFVLCALNLLVPIHFEGSNSVESVFSLWWIIPFISMIIFVISLVLTIKKKLSIVFTIVLFLLFSANITEMAVGTADLWEREYYTLGGTVYFGDGSYKLRPEYWCGEQYSSMEDASQAIDRMGLSRTLSSKINLCNSIDSIEIGAIRMNEYITGNTEDAVVIVSIVEGGIFVLYLISNVIYGLIVARKKHD